MVKTFIEGNTTKEGLILTWQESETGERTFEEIEFSDYFYVKLDDYYIIKDELKKKWKSCLKAVTEIEANNQFDEPDIFAKIIFSDNTQKNFVKQWIEDEHDIATFEADLNTTKRYIIDNHNEIDMITIEYESKFDTEENNIPNKLYHLTIKEYSNKIDKSGLIPRSKSKLSSHLDRIYLCKTYQDCIDLIPQMLFYYTGEKDENIYKLGKKLYNKDITPVIYEIDNSSNIIDKLYIDINYNKKGYYTLNNIPADKIKQI